MFNFVFIYLLKKYLNEKKNKIERDINGKTSDRVNFESTKNIRFKEKLGSFRGHRTNFSYPHMVHNASDRMNSPHQLASWPPT
jgi:hypothetical protein